MLVYVDNVLHIARDPKKDMDRMNSIYQLKDGVGPTDRYLGDSVGKFQLHDGSVAWEITCVDYTKGAIEKFMKTLQVSGTALNNFGYGKRPYPPSYRPELYVTSKLDDEITNRYQKLSGILRG